MLDLLVIGGGMAGLSAAAWSAERGLHVTVVEKSDQLGGSASMAGYVWTAASADALMSEVPGVDADMGRALVSEIGEGVEWIQSLGVNCHKPITMLRFGRGVPVDMPGYIRACDGVIQHSPHGKLLVSAQTERLLLEEGAVVGAEVRPSDGSVQPLRARFTLLATGGYQNDRALSAQLIHPNASAMPRRTNPHSSGDGLRLGQAAGGQFGKGGAGFYGHLIPFPLDLPDPSMFKILTMFFSEHSLLLNKSGRRFVDETVGDHLSAQAVLEQQGGRALLVADELVRREWIVQPYVDGIETGDKLGEAARRGGHYASAADLESVGEVAGGWGYDRRAVVDSIRRFNSGGLSLPRRFDARPLVEPPYHLIEVWPAITFTYGGLLTDSHGRVLDENGVAIPGLLAAGADAGGLYVRAYAGGLAPALVFGLRAAKMAANRAFASA
ncbi:MAG TPA: FAD-dependent oxidoreductase [Acetobacteraceae bacterium]|nr:FAD-dependent oxidoreductase [Acetobacteraceae bacterium]